MTELKLTGWDTFERASSLEKFNSISGGSEFGYANWNQYLETIPENLRSRMEILRTFFLKYPYIYGDQHQEWATPIFSDGSSLGFSLRGWGDFMSVLYDPPNTKYGYMNYYVSSPRRKSPVIFILKITAFLVSAVVVGSWLVSII